MSLCSCIYEGTVRHRRFAPVPHEFRYRLFLMYVDLDELPELFDRYWLWSTDRPNVAWFRRSDHTGVPPKPLSESIRELVHVNTGKRPEGPIRLLTHFRYLGLKMNPISVYYCFDRRHQLESVVAEVTNTPWGEQHCYVLEACDRTRSTTFARAVKALHVSPFLTMDYQYLFRLTNPGSTLSLHIESRPRADENDNAVLDAMLHLVRRPINSWQLSRVLMRYPIMTGQVFAGIYWQAFRLWRKQIPFVPHPPAAQQPTRGGAEYARPFAHFARLEQASQRAQHHDSIM